MKQKEKTSLRGMTIVELKKQLTDMQQKLAALRLSRYTKQSKNVRESKVMRQKVAVLSSIICEKESAHE